MAIILYLIYLLSGVLKVISIFYGFKFPFDLTLVTAVLLLVYLVYDFYIHKFRTKHQSNIIIPLLLLFVFFIWIIVSVFYSVSDGYVYRKTILFVTNIIAFIFPLLISKFNLKKFLRFFSVFVIFAFVWFYFIYFILMGKLKGTEVFYQVMGLTLTLAVYGGLILLVLLTSREKIFKSIFLNVFVITLLAVFLILSGARGPIFFVLISLSLFYFGKLFSVKFFRPFKLIRLLKGLSVFVVFIFAVFLAYYKFSDKISALLERSLYRISLIINGITDSSGMGDSVDVRVNQFEFAVNSILKNVQSFFAGYGFGSFGIMYTGEDGRLYPHNILLEVWFELGFIGFIIFVAFLISVFFGKIKKKIIISGFVMLYIFLNMLKSSSIVDIRVFFAFFAFFIVNENLKQTEVR